MHSQLRYSIVFVAAAAVVAVLVTAGGAAGSSSVPTVSLADPGEPLSSTVALVASADPTAGQIITSVAVQWSPAGANQWHTIATVTSPPYSTQFDTTTVPDGSYDLRAQATDSSGAVGTSPLLTRTVVNSPSVSLEDPGTALQAIVPITADVSVPSGRTVTSVAFAYSPAGADNWTTFAVDTDAPYRQAFDTTQVPDGEYDIRAVLTDSSNETASDVLKDRIVNNNNPGATALLSDPGAALSGTLKLDATVTAGLFPIAGVAFQVSPAGKRQWKTVGTTKTAPYAVSVDTTKLADGRYDLRAVATDGGGNQIFSPDLTNRWIDNSAPTTSFARPKSPLVGQVTLKATAADASSGVSTVRFERAVHGSSTWILIGVRRATPYSLVFDSRSVPNGSYDFRTVANDAAGNRATSAIVSDIAVDNPAVPVTTPPTIDDIVGPAHGVVLLGSVAGSSQHETWAAGFTNGPPASVNGTRLPYTAQGQQVVLLRYLDSTGWEIVDVPRMPDGSAFQLLPANEVDNSGVLVRGSMAPSGEGWLWIAETATDGSVRYGLFHRPAASNGRFVFDSADTAALGPSLLAPKGIARRQSELTLRTTPSGPVGVLVSPGQDTAPMTLTSAEGTPVEISTQLSYGVLANGSWSAETVTPLPESYQPIAGDSLSLQFADVSGAGAGWGALSLESASTRPVPLMLGRFDQTGWKFVSTGLDGLDLTGAFAQAGEFVQPTGLLASGNAVWIGATLNQTGSTHQDSVVARYDGASRQITDSWCTNQPESSSCIDPLDGAHPAAVPSAIFSTNSGDVALAQANGFVDEFREGEWTQIAAPGFAVSASSIFSSPNEGWIAGDRALGHWHLPNNSAPMTAWPEPNRSTLTGVAAPPTTPDSAGPWGSGALAVGLHGTALQYDPGQGWVDTALPPHDAQLNLTSVAFSGPSSAMAVGQSGVLIRWNGTKWTEDPQSVSLTENLLNSVAFSSTGQGWAVGTFGTILHFDGSSWNIEQPPPEDEGVDITSVAVSGSDVFAIADGNLIERKANGTWAPVAQSLLPNPAPQPGDLRVVSGLPDGGLVVAGRSVVLTRSHAGNRLEYSDQPVDGIAVAAAATRDGAGDIEPYVSVAQPALDPNTLTPTNDVAGYPPGDGELLRETAGGGWQDLSRAQYPGGTALPGDGVVKSDPALAVAPSSDGAHAWVVGGYAGTISAAGQGTAAVLPTRPLGWQTASIWRFDAGSPLKPPPSPAGGIVLTDLSGLVNFAFFTSPDCRDQCSATQDAQPNVNLESAEQEISTFAQQPGGPAFAILGGNARGPVDPNAYQAGNGAADFAQLPSVLKPLGKLPLYAAFGPLDSVPGLEDPTEPWADAFSGAPAPFGPGAPPSGIKSAGAGGLDGGVHRYYAFDATENDGTIRLIVLDNSAGSLDGTWPGQTKWLEAQLAAANAAQLPVVVFAPLPLGPAGQPGIATDGIAVATLLANAGVLAAFTTNPNQQNQQFGIPDPLKFPQIPEYEGASLGYQQTGNGGVQWYDVSVDTLANQVSVNAVPVIDSLSIKPLDGVTVKRSSTLRFQGIARRPIGSLATTPNNDSFPGFDNYVTIPASGLCAGCTSPTYIFASSNPVVGDFVTPTGAGSSFPFIDPVTGRPDQSPTSGLFCAYNSGKTTISLTVGLLTAQIPLTVTAGGSGPPCGTVPNPNAPPVVVTSVGAAPSAAAPPPPAPAPASSAPAPLPILPVPPPAPVPAAPQTPPVPAAPAPPPIAILPPPVPAGQPVPPGGATAPGTAQQPSSAPRRERARKHASQSAFAVRPAGVDAAEWFYPATAGATLFALLAAALGVRPSVRRRRSYAYAEVSLRRRDR